jgi:hypothetical protein
MKIEELKVEQMKYYKLERYNPQKLKFSKLNIESIIYNLCFILYYLNYQGYTLSCICVDDFEMSDNILFLKKDVHIVELNNNTFIYKKESKGLCFSKDIPDGRAKIEETYASVGLFIYYLYFKKVMKNLTEKNYGKLKGTKPYYFIKNTMAKYPCLIYL